MTESLTRVQRRQRATRERIFRAAMELFARKGFEQTTIVEISAAADIGKGTFFTYFPTKESIFAYLGEQPALLLATLAALLRAGDGAGSERGPRASFTELRDRIAMRLAAPLRRRFLTTLGRVRAGHLAREASLYMIEEAFVVARQGAREAARRLAAAGALAASDELRFLTLSELGAALRGQRPPAELRGLVERRRGARPRAAAAWHARVEPARPRAEGGLLTGLSGSPGVATGPVRIIAGPEAFDRLQPGDVLVCRYTDPAWTPLFALAAAVVADTGGPLSHAAIVAREYGIPAALGTQSATTRLRDGALVCVDGTAGVVREPG